MESNFKKALKEVIGINKSAKTENGSEDNNALKASVKNKKNDIKPDFKETISKTNNITLESIKEVEQKKLKQSNSGQTPSASETNVSEASIITKSTKIEGSIVTDSNLVIFGEMIGNVTSSNSISTTGKIVGNIACKNFEGSNAKIEGDIKVENNLIIKDNCDITGDISAKKIELSGKVKGNIIFSGEVILSKEAYIIGNVTANTISIEKGAIIQGSIQIGSENISA